MRTALHLSAMTNLKGLTKKLLAVADAEAEAQLINEKDAEGNTPLHYACQNIDPGEPTYVDPSANALLDVSSADLLDTSENIIDQLLAHHASIDISNGYGMTPLHVATTFGNSYAVNAILDICSAPHIVNAADTLGRTPLHLALRTGNVTNITKLLDISANVYLVDKDQTAPIHIAASMGNLSVLIRLLDISSGLVNVEDVNGWTPLHWAAYAGHHYCVRELVDRGAVKDKTNTQNDMPLHLATRMGHQLSALILMSTNLPQ